MLTHFRNKTVLVTGNTGFKGSWLSAWLVKLGARVVGLSLDIPSKPAHFSAANMDLHLTHIWGDVRDPVVCQAAIRDHAPDFVFHLAAQPLVRKSYSDPLFTFQSNVLGTLNMLEALRLSCHPCTAVFITSDKCYDNVEQAWGYRENDRLGGKDPYSGSKGAAELVIRSYAATFFASSGSPVRVAVGRAGNVIGGGDWAEDRIVPDAMRAWSLETNVLIRNPRATRPWQHVLEPLVGYLTLAARLYANSNLNGEAFNFGPAADQNYSVSELLNALRGYWPAASWQDGSDPNAPYEAGLLKLCCDKALHMLGWKPILSFEENVAMTSEWYRNFYDGDCDIWALTQRQIAHYERLAADQHAIWTRS